MVAGYAAFQTQLKVTGSSTVTSNWDIEITNVTAGTPTGSAENAVAPSYDKLWASMEANLYDKGDAMEYDVTIENKGTLDAKLNDIITNLDNSNNEAVIITFSGYTKGEVLKAKTSKVVHVKIEYNPEYEGGETSSEVEINFDYGQNNNEENNPDSQYLLTYDYSTNGGTSVELTEELIASGSNVDLSNAATKEGWTFVGWNTDKDAQIGLENYQMPASNTTLYAIYSKTLKVTYEKGENIDSIGKNEDSCNIYNNGTSCEITLPEITPSLGYVIDGWYEDTTKVGTQGDTFILDNNKILISKSIVLDNEKPKITISVKQNFVGENNWYKDLTLNVKVTDNKQLKDVFYCITTKNTCDPNKTTDLIDGQFDYTFEEHKQSQKMCVKALDEIGNEITRCSDQYLVDGIEPNINNITLTPDDDSLLVNIEAEDTSSGPYVYYFSKDGGNSYVISNNPNYTFTGLAEGDYLILTYVEDKAGNISKTSVGNATIRHNSFCMHNNIEDFGDCIIATEANETDITMAKQKIESKENPNFNVTSPSVTYEQNVNDFTVVQTTTLGRLVFGSDYTFDSNTGLFKLTGTTTAEVSKVDYTKTPYVVAINHLIDTNDSMYKIENIKVTKDENDGEIYSITMRKYTSKPLNYDTSTVGMYATNDNDGKTYYYRGSVAGNYVKFNDYYWRIVRVNGDGTVRLIYDGTKLYQNGEANVDRQIGTGGYSNNASGNSYVGYMYGNPNNYGIYESPVSFTNNQLSSTSNYVFGTSYTFDKKARKFKPAGTIKTGKVASDKVGYYTCLKTDINDTCNLIYKTEKYINTSSMQMKVTGYQGATAAINQKNEISNLIKQNLDNWYKSNFQNSNQISKSALFCNNRTLSNNPSSSMPSTGDKMTPTRYGQDRFTDANGKKRTGPILTCPSNDSFSASSTKGNGSLSYPVGLITADEVNMAGGTVYSVNALYYLNSGNSYWTMSPYQFNTWGNAHVVYVNETGKIDSTYAVVLENGVRPVINIDTKAISFTGSGTINDPYILK